MKHFDVAVLGGGPAGSATALAAIQLGHSAIVIERSGYEITRIGETMPPSVHKLLTDLRVWPQFLAEKHLPSFGVRSAWGRPVLYDNDFIFDPYGAGWHVERRRFDALLASAAEEAGVIVCRQSRVVSLLERLGGEWEFEIAPTGQLRRFRATFVVDATGRTPAFACRWGARRFVVDHLIGVIGYFSPTVKSAADGGYTLLEATEEGWWYSAIMPDGHAVAAYMTDADLYSRGSRATARFWQMQFERTVHTLDRLRTFRLKWTPQAVAASSAVMDRAVGATWLTVGDAACAVDPLSSLGIYKALQSGLRAAGAINERFAGDEAALLRYALRVHDQFDVYLSLRTQFYRREMRWPRSMFWRRRHGEQSKVPSRNAVTPASPHASLAPSDREAVANWISRGLVNEVPRADDL
jgi:flavin-dependent dehydrogenase